jgi:hypothetical protein
MRTFSMRTFGLVILLAAAACQQGKSKLDDIPAKTVAPNSGGSGSAAGSDADATVEDLDSKDILARTETAASVDVKHVLIAWNHR